MEAVVLISCCQVLDDFLQKRGKFAIEGFPNKLGFAGSVASSLAYLFLMLENYYFLASLYFAYS